MKIETLALNQSHIPQILEIESNAHLTPWSEKVIASSFGPRSHVFGLTSKDTQPNELLAYCFVSVVAGEMSLENICVATHHQGKGFAKRLLRHLLELAVELECSEVLLEVRASNIAAIALYEQAGFNTVALRKGYYSIPKSDLKEDALIMKLLLENTTVS